MKTTGTLLLLLLVAALGCQSSSDHATCAEAFDHMAALAVDRGGASLDADQRARHREVLARAIGRAYQPDCSNDDSARIECVLEARDPATAASCWRK
jgi:hypothetical protein